MSRVGRDERARLHEVASALAGIRAATTLLNEPGGVDGERRAALAQMAQSELQRLERMVQKQQESVSSETARLPASRQEDEVAEVIDLDAVVGTIVLAHEAKGTEVEWRPSRMLALGDSDQLTEALNVLLDNAATHGSGPVRIDVRAADRPSTSVEIAVTDDGPGVAPELRRRIFAWGVSGPDSTGQGIGLHAARDLMERQGGYLELSESGERTTFVIGIPLLGRADVADERASGQGGRRGFAT
ncbi:sensor histidine kinase [Nocardioides panzhihuensis]|uniref:histidine kinase n=1 Tax=Nocardioides panzhihuensis TaxID=860243 RepID=A0A7Z0DHG7_9ACTN|nr:ATP-binding protein [Nocardioides panzhihuensis]NYI75671.1 signal transduction histidine kinase [Nocardioides panzhihuensis]